MGSSMSEPLTEKNSVQIKDTRYSVGASSMQGWRVSMEDAHSLMLEMEGDKSASYFAVFDGHGGKEVARYASENLHLHIINSRHYDQGDRIKALKEAFLSLDRELLERYGLHAKLSGSTAVCLLIVDGFVHCANLGDSRAIACVDRECVQLSYDHKPDNDEEWRRIKAAGGYVEGSRVNGNLALSRALGDFNYKSNQQLPASEQMVSPCPEVKSIELNDKLDFLLLACDGIWDVLVSEEVIEFVSERIEEKMSPSTICEQLMTVCLAPDYERPVGCDNMTVVLICYTKGLSYEDYCEEFASRSKDRTKKSPNRFSKFHVFDEDEAQNGDDCTQAPIVYGEDAEKDLKEPADKSEGSDNAEDKKDLSISQAVTEQPEAQEATLPSHSEVEQEVSKNDNR